MTTSATPAKGSLRLRFIIAVLVWIIAGLLVIGLSTSALFRRHVENQYHEELQVHLVELADLTRLDSAGRPILDRPLSDPRYTIANSGFYWQVERDNMPPLTSASMRSGALDASLAHQPDIVHRLAPGPTGPTMTYGFARPAPDGRGEIHFLIATDERILNAVLHAFDHELQRWLGLLALGLFATGGLVVLYGLKPLDQLGRAVAAVRSGSARRMEGRWPAELAPLVADLNGLLDTNEAMVARARLEAGNLAHSLRTSLAILSDEAETLTRGQTGESAATLLEQCRRIARQLDWHLARARSGARVGSGTAIPESICAILSAMERLHAERCIRFHCQQEGAATLAIEPDDFAEILSNLVDNAGKWATREVDVTWHLEDGRAFIAIADDGPGIPETERACVFDAGKRLDEQTPGHGLGLAIAQDLANSHAGSIALSSRADGRPGLCATLILPTLSGR